MSAVTKILRRIIRRNPMNEVRQNHKVNLRRLSDPLDTRGSLGESVKATKQKMKTKIKDSDTKRRVKKKLDSEARARNMDRAHVKAQDRRSGKERRK